MGRARTARYINNGLDAFYTTSDDMYYFLKCDSNPWITHHPRKSGYPGLTDIKKYGLKPQGMP